MNFEFSDTFTLIGSNGKEIPLSYSTKKELKNILEKHITPTTKFYPVYKMSGIKFDEDTGRMETITVLESIKLIK